MFEPVHGCAPKYAGQDKVNPTALLRSGVLMLSTSARRGRRADGTRGGRVIAEGKQVTYDLGGSAGTSGMAAAIARRIAG